MITFLSGVYFFLIISLTVYAIFKSHIIELDPKELQILNTKPLKLLLYFSVLAVAFGFLWFFYASNDERVQFQLDSNFLLASEELKLQTNSSDRDGLVKTNRKALCNWDELQKLFECCRIISYQDWLSVTGINSFYTIPGSCGVNEKEKRSEKLAKKK